MIPTALTVIAAGAILGYTVIGMVIAVWLTDMYRDVDPQTVTDRFIDGFMILLVFGALCILATHVFGGARFSSYGVTALLAAGVACGGMSAFALPIVVQSPHLIRRHRKEHR